MSEAIPDLQWTPPPATIRDASAVILWREKDGEREVFWVRRGKKVSFSAGYYAFPGGKVDPEDGAVPIADAPPGGAALRVAAIREVFEETGVLLAPGAASLPLERLGELRRRLLAKESFAALLDEAGIELSADVLLPAGRWLTPDFSPIRFDTRFFLAKAPEGVRPAVEEGELQRGAWVRPAEALRLWEAGRVLLHPPNRHALAVLAGFPVESAIPLLRQPPFVDEGHVVRRIDFQRGILTYPLRTPTLPPAQHTNCFVVGTGEMVAIDPGSPDPSEQARLAAEIAELQREGRKLVAVLLTHHHRDHVGGAASLARRFEVPIRASAATRKRLPEVDELLAEGDRIVLDGPLPMELRCLLTEGHAEGHLCFHEPRSGALIAGDMVAENSTILIDPPEGDMGVYLASLRRLRDLPVGVIYPAHGFPIPDGPALLQRYLDHREARLARLAEALHAAEGALPLARLVETVYSDTPSHLHPVAARSALASLLELERRGMAREEAEGWIAPGAAPSTQG